MLMWFRIISWVSLLAAVLGLSYYRFKKQKEFQSFAMWMRVSLGKMIKERRTAGAADWYDLHLVRPNPLSQRWIFIGLVLSFLYLALSGFFFALFFPRPLLGIFLMAHVGLGGVFAVCLAGVVFFRARVYDFSQTDDPRGSQAGSMLLFSRLLFWIFVGSGLALVLTALFMMLPLLAQPGHIKIVDVHRYSALTAVLSALTFAVFNLDTPHGRE